MAIERLTPRRVAALSTEQTQEEFWDEVCPGLALRVGRGGSKVYVVRYRSGGRNRRLKLGTHPHMTLADARKRARKAVTDAQGGEDPAEAKRARQSQDATFGALVEEVLAAKSKNREGTKKNRQWAIDRDLLPAWKDRPVSSITRRDVVRLIDGIVARGAPVQANRTLGIVKMLFNEGLRRGFPTLEANPAHMLAPVADEERRRRFLERDELRTVWRALEWEAPVTRGVFQFAILTTQRIANVRALRWDAIDNSDVWHIPAAEFKGKRDHLVPLSKQALAALKPLRELTGNEEYVFVGRSDGKAAHVGSTNSALRRIRGRTDIPHWNVHDFRTTFRTHATRAVKPAHRRDPAGLGIAPNVADAVLGHKEASLGADRYTGEPERYMLSEKRDALKKWGAFVAGTVKGGAA